MAKWWPARRDDGSWMYRKCDAALFAEWHAWYQAQRQAEYEAWFDAHYDAAGVWIEQDDGQASDDGSVQTQEMGSGSPTTPSSLSAGEGQVGAENGQWQEGFMAAIASGWDDVPAYDSDDDGTPLTQ